MEMQTFPGLQHYFQIYLLTAFRGIWDESSIMLIIIKTDIILLLILLFDCNRFVHFCGNFILQMSASSWTLGHCWVPSHPSEYRCFYDLILSITANRKPPLLWSSILTCPASRRVPCSYCCNYNKLLKIYYCYYYYIVEIYCYWSSVHA